MRFTLCVPCLDFLPLSGTRSVISRPIVSSVSMGPWAVSSVSLVASADIDVLLCLGGFASCFRGVSFEYAHKPVVHLACPLFDMTNPNLGRLGGVVWRIVI